MNNDSKTINRLLAAGIPRSKAAEEHADPLPQIKQAKLTPVEWVRPKVVTPDELPTDNAARYLEQLRLAKLKARAKGG